jgi:hypothetical protein
MVHAHRMRFEAFDLLREGSRNSRLYRKESISQLTQPKGRPPIVLAIFYLQVLWPAPAYSRRGGRATLRDLASASIASMSTAIFSSSGFWSADVLVRAIFRRPRIKRGRKSLSDCTARRYALPRQHTCLPKRKFRSMLRRFCFSTGTKVLRTGNAPKIPLAQFCRRHLPAATGNTSNLLRACSNSADPEYRNISNANVIVPISTCIQ